MKNIELNLSMNFKISFIKIEFISSLLNYRTIIRFRFYKNHDDYKNNIKHLLCYETSLCNDNMLEIFENFHIMNIKMKDLIVASERKLLYTNNFDTDTLKVESCGENNYKLTFYKDLKPVLVSNLSGFEIVDVIEQLIGV